MGGHLLTCLAEEDLEFLAKQAKIFYWVGMITDSEEKFRNLDGTAIDIGKLPRGSAFRNRPGYCSYYFQGKFKNTECAGGGARFACKKGTVAASCGLKKEKEAKTKGEKTKDEMTKGAKTKEEKTKDDKTKEAKTKEDKTKDVVNETKETKG